ncbi:hypothetical protein DRE_02996 [Drechslerella stenobrocha 248]|uniref:Uncharacterized protein n=1 Tax=Drechslerella stenobrocha 248 TaxID=1043628 RepID=W7HUB5_9PEZI|nr:hypothetical protein DRE_02996 [Drechslerella stenobrocha 248]
MDLTTARWHPSRFKHHFVTNYLCKAKEKHKPSLPTTVCSAFLLDELASAERTIETDVLLRCADFNDRQLLILPTKLYETGSSQDAGYWITYIVARGETKLPTRFEHLASATSNTTSGNLVIISVGGHSARCEELILRLLYRDAERCVQRNCLAYSFVVRYPQTLYERCLQPSHARHVESVEDTTEREEWRRTWAVIDLAEGVLRGQEKAVSEILKAEGDVARLEIPA